MKYHRKTVGKHTSKHTRKNHGVKFGMRKTMKGGGMFDNWGNLFNFSEWSINPFKQSSVPKTPDAPVSSASTTASTTADTTVKEAPITDAVNTNNLNTSGPPGLSGLTEPSGPTKVGGWIWGGRKRRAKKNKTAKKSGLKKGGGKK
jgi:hypothetical protein